MNSMAQAIDYVLQTAAAKKIVLEVLASEKVSTTVDMQARKVDQFSFSESRELGVRVVAGLNEGLAYSESLDIDSLDEMIGEAVANSRMIKKDTSADLRSAAQLPSMDFLFNSHLQEISPEKKIAAAAALESAALDFDPRITNVPHCRYRDSWTQHWIANSNGLIGQFQTNSCSAYLGCIAKDGDAKVSASEATYTRDFTALNPEKLGVLAATKTLNRLGARRPSTGRYTVVFENRIAEQLVSLIGEYFSAKAVLEKNSPLAGKLGQIIFSKEFTLTDDPLYAAGVVSRPFDDEGFSSQKTILVDAGHVTNFLTNSVFARKMNLPHTAHGSRAPSTDLNISPSNLIVKPGPKTIEQLMNADTQVIKITNILGMAGFRATSGDFSIPVEGHLFENGKPSYALKDFLISGNLIQLFGSIESVGQDVLSPVGTTICPSLLVRDLNVSGAS